MTDAEFLLEYARHVPAEFPQQAFRLCTIAARLVTDYWEIDGLQFEREQARRAVIEEVLAVIEDIREKEITGWTANRVSDRIRERFGVK